MFKLLSVLVIICAVSGGMALWLWLLMSGMAMALDGATDFPINGSALTQGIIRVILAAVIGVTTVFMGALAGGYMIYRFVAKNLGR